MRFYDGSYDTLVKAHKSPKKLPLFLLPQVGNPHDKNAIMLSDGSKKLASVLATEAESIKNTFGKWTHESGVPEVMVVEFAKDYSDVIKHGDFPRQGVLHLRCVGRVNERIARKYIESLKV